MKIIKQSFEPLPDLNDHIANIARASRICYKSEDKAKDDETNFVRGLVKGKHNSTLEMSVLHLMIQCNEMHDAFELLESNYIISDPVPDNKQTIFCTASIRGWREFIQSESSDLRESINAYLSDTLPRIFTNDLYSSTLHHNIAEFDPKTLPPEVAKHHIHQGIKFITNRAVTHELVRHRPCAFLQESQRYCAYNKDQFDGEVTFIEPSAFCTDPTKNSFYDIWFESCTQAEIAYFDLLEIGASPQAARTVLPNSCKTEIIVYCSLAQWEHIFAMRHSSKCDPSMQEAIAPVFNWFCKEYPEHFTTKENLQRSVG